MSPVPEAPLRISIAVCAYVLLVVCVTLWGLDLGLRRSGCAGPIRRSLLGRLGALLGTWFVALTAAATSGAWLSPDMLRPLGYLVPALALSAVLWRAGWLQAAVQSLSPSVIPWLQTLRIGSGLSLFGASAARLAPWSLAATTGTGDIVVGAGGALVGFLLAARTSWSRTVAQVWNVFGLLLVAYTLVRWLLSVPGPLQRFHSYPPNLVPAVFPFLYLPGFILPLTLLLHILSLQQLARLGPALAAKR